MESVNKFKNLRSINTSELDAGNSSQQNQNMQREMMLEIGWTYLHQPERENLI